MRAHANDLFRRLTDLDIRDRIGKRPLEVGANLISRTAVAALVLLDEIRHLTGSAIPLAWGEDDADAFRAIEVYPAATRLAHGAVDVGGSLLGLENVLDCSAVPSHELQSADAVDAAVCVLAAGDFMLGLADPPYDEEVARVEGWIWGCTLAGGVTRVKPSTQVRLGCHGRQVSGLRSLCLHILVEGPGGVEAESSHSVGTADTERVG